MKNVLKEKMRKGEKVLGTFFEIGSAIAVECLGMTGLDFLIIDTEHGPFDVESSLEFVRAAERRSITPLVRVKDPTRPSILKMLDIGAQGLIIPCITTVDEVKKLVEYGKFYPLGRRGFATSRAGGFGYDEIAAKAETYFRVSNEETLLIPQCETAGCLEHIEEVAALDGVDGIFVGPYDLSVALGRPAQFDTDEFAKAVARILKACKDSGKFSLIYADKPDAARQRFADGFDCIAYGMDTMFYVNSIRAQVKELRP